MSLYYFAQKKEKRQRKAFVIGLYNSVILPYILRNLARSSCTQNLQTINVTENRECIVLQCNLSRHSTKVYIWLLFITLEHYFWNFLEDSKQKLVIKTICKRVNELSLRKPGRHHVKESPWSEPDLNEIFTEYPLNTLMRHCEVRFSINSIFPSFYPLLKLHV